MFDPYLEQLNKSILLRGGEKIPVPDDLGERRSDRGDSCIKSWLWNIEGFRRWRVTRLDAGEKLQVLNSVAYPEYINDQPLLGIDLLWFGGKKKLVAVMDFQPLIQEESYFETHFQGLKRLHKTFPELHIQKNMKVFDPNQYFSPWILFYKGDIDNAKSALPLAYKSFLNSYWDLYDSFAKRTSLINSIEVMRLQSLYDQYGLERDPAHGLFTSFFGKDWSDRFLNEFLFPSVNNSHISDDLNLPNNL